MTAFFREIDRTAAASICLALLLALPLLCIAQVAPTPGASTCRFCLAEQPDTAYLCPHCGRLFRIESLDPAHRFWGDAFYILYLPANTARPELVAEVSDAGLIRETASFDLGDRYEYGPGKKGIEITARVVGTQSKEVDYRATFVDRHDEEGRLSARIVSGQLNAKPKRFLHRRIAYGYDGDRIEVVNAKSYIYAKENDRDKRPGQWIRHQENHRLRASGTIRRNR